MFEIFNLHYYYDNIHALRGINLKINKKRTIIVGSNGAGKTTLLMHLNGLLKPHRGYIKYNGRKIKYDKKSLIKLRREVAFVFQNPDDQIVAPTVEQDVAFGLINLGIEDYEDRVREALEIVGLKGYEKRLTSELSFGEKKKVAIAGVLSMKPKVVLFDEPTSGLDPKSRREFINIIEDLDSNLIITTHDMNFALEVADEIVVLHRGAVVSKGKPEDVFLKDDLEKYELEKPILVKVYESLNLNTYLNGKLPRNVEELVHIIAKCNFKHVQDKYDNNY